MGDQDKVDAVRAAKIMTMSPEQFYRHFLKSTRRFAAHITRRERLLDMMIQKGTFWPPLSMIEEIKFYKEALRQYLPYIEKRLEALGVPVPNPKWKRPEWL